MSSRPDQKNRAELASHKADQLKSIHAGSNPVQFMAYSGPLPHPEILRDFESVLPGSAERILVQFEEQSAHRQKMEMSVVSAGVFSQKIGSVSAALIGILGCGGGIWLTHEGKDVAGLTALFGTLAGLAATFLYKRRQQDEERDHKRNSVQKMS